jgi:hypothetical protein
MRTDAETELWVFVEHLPVRRFLIDVGRQEFLVLENLLHESANFFPPGGTGLGFKNPMAL